jgi:hypothetical protein
MSYPWQSNYVVFLETAARDQLPFLLFHSFTHVHTPHATRLIIASSFFLDVN